MHQPFAQRRVRDAEALHREIERISGNLPEIRVPALARPQPSVLQLFFPPQRGELLECISQDVAAASRRGGVIEKRAIGVEDASPNIFQHFAPVIACRACVRTQRLTEQPSLPSVRKELSWIALSPPRWC